MAGSCFSHAPAGVHEVRIRYFNDTTLAGEIAVLSVMLLHITDSVKSNTRPRSQTYKSFVKCSIRLGFANFSVLYTSDCPLGIDSECHFFSASNFPRKTICPT